MFSRFAATPLYIRVEENRLRLRLVGGDGAAQEIIARASEPFSSERLLVGSFSAAEATLRQAMQTLFTGRWNATAPAILFHPLEKVEGGLSEVEQRVFQDLGAVIGARRVSVWVGHELSDEEVRQQLAHG